MDAKAFVDANSDIYLIYPDGTSTAPYPIDVDESTVFEIEICPLYGERLIAGEYTLYPSLDALMDVIGD